MSRNENVANSIWSDPDYMRLTPAGKLMYLWSFTNPRCGMAGLYKVPLEFAAVETGLSLSSVQNAVNELGVARFAHYIDGVLWVRSRVKHIHSRTPQIARSIAKDLGQIDVRHPLLGAFLDLYGAQPWLREQLAGVTQDFLDSSQIGRTSGTSGGSESSGGSFNRVSAMVSDEVQT